jgi:hypothetical protein
VVVGTPALYLGHQIKSQLGDQLKTVPQGMVFELLTIDYDLFFCNIYNSVFIISLSFLIPFYISPS